MKTQLEVIKAVLETLIETGGGPSGMIYAALSSRKVGLSFYNRMIQMLVRSNAISVDNHFITPTERAKEYLENLQKVLA